LPGFWQATITPSPSAAAPASAAVPSNATASRPAVAIARPYTVTPFVDDADRRIRASAHKPDGRKGHVASIPHG
jgi:hypothetical protein